MLPFLDMKYLNAAVQEYFSIREIKYRIVENIQNVFDLTEFNLYLI